jgi:metal-responsive CopG/Arc/MetJ family transcriptional regulator
MKVLKPRSRMISVRLSQSEYEELCRLSTITGARSLSDLTRDAMRSFLEKSAHEHLSTEVLQGFQAQMDRLSRRIDELQDQLISPQPRPEEESS